MKERFFFHAAELATADELRLRRLHLQAGAYNSSCRRLCGPVS